ncbi:BlaI family transcriptional regulator, penicillinase repressor [Paenibacillus uliginis N3/975]|uniref:BlaI family transcriptional regulator, penicillinase repressor n=1 Tax=Paenibacillus uliginis N3/975 TaxID=1313296 RepID=A0A1X7HEA9_9BACL|nr:BlaI/MecI/CopY family transcriptional regulator [Paenibacillus uliginis]SMF84653.1 BlaI family transcriptional regulator, penicillinase repressor [Paenibacillus uliginis N3/975]
MDEQPRISDAEWEIMKVIWTKSPATASDVILALRDHKTWKDKTVKTLLNRLLQKGILTFEQINRVYYYSPARSEEECKRTERQSFLQRVYGGALKPMLVHYLQEEQLSSQEIDELKKILSEKEK